MSDKRRKIIIDCDPGHDDLAAILLAAHSSDLKIEAVTTVCGNAPLAMVTKNALAIAEYYLPEVPVHAGAEAPLLHRYPFPEAFHGVTGMDSIGAQYGATTRRPAQSHAALAIIEMVRAAPGEITIVALAAMTNLALAVSLAPDLPRLIREVVFMGGGTEGGNVTPAAEFNIWADPEAARIVLSSGVRATMFGLNVTERATLFNADHAAIADVADPNPLADTLRFYMDSYRGPLSDDRGSALHDVCPIAWLIDPTLFHVAPARVTVATEEGPGYGATHVQFDATRPNLGVATDLDDSRLRALVRDALIASAKINSTNETPERETLS